MKWKSKPYTAVSTTYDTLKSKVTISCKSQSIIISEAYGRVLYRDIFSRTNIPSFPSSHMDGFAVKAKNIKLASKTAPVALKILQSVGLGKSPNQVLQSGQAYRITTGGYLPYHSDTVVPIELVRILSENYVEIFKSLPKGSFVSATGTDVRIGTKIFRKGSILRAQDIAFLSKVNIRKIEVFKKPTVAIIPTGDELTDNMNETRTGKIINTNSHIISRVITELGAMPTDMGITPDNIEKIQNKLKLALTNYDIIVTIGGSSIGEQDLIEESVNSLGKPGIIAHGVKLDRGRVAGVGVIKGKPIIILPGPIQGALNAFIVFGQPLIRFLSGLPECSTKTMNAMLTRCWDARPKFQSFLKIVYLQTSLSDKGCLNALPIQGETSAISVMTRANSYMIVPPHVAHIDEGKKIKVNFLPGISYSCGHFVDIL